MKESEILLEDQELLSEYVLIKTEPITQTLQFQAHPL